MFSRNNELLLNLLKIVSTIPKENISKIRDLIKKNLINTQDLINNIGSIRTEIKLLEHDRSIVFGVIEILSKSISHFPAGKDYHKELQNKKGCKFFRTL